MNASLSTDVPTPADIAVDNPPRDPQAVVKRKSSLPQFIESNNPRVLNARERERRRASEAVMRCQVRYRQLAVRLKRIAAARGMTAEQLLDEMERG